MIPLNLSLTKGLPSALCGKFVISTFITTVLAVTFLWIGGCAEFEETILPDEEQKKDEIPVVEPFRPITAIRVNRVINIFGQETETRTKIYRDGYKVRSEDIDSNPPATSIFDYKNKLEFKIQEGDHIYFEVGIAETQIKKAQREGVIPLQPNPRIETQEILIGDIEIDGHPCEIILLVQKEEVKIRGRDFNKYDYTLRFEALDLGRQPVRVAYNQTWRVLIIVDFQDIKEGPIDPKLLNVPEDFLSFTPY